jgi:hypothetical protein
MISYMMVFLAFLALLWYCPEIMISYMISYFLVWYHIWYHKQQWFLAFLALSSYDFAYDIIYISYENGYDISMLWYQRRYHAITPLISLLISVCCDIIALWYHNFHDIIALIMAPARRNGAGCGRHAPGAPPRHRQRTPSQPGDCSLSLTTQVGHIPVVVNFRTRPLRLIVTVIPPGVRVTWRTLSHWPQPQADSGSFKLRTPIKAVVTQRWACARHRTSANNWDTTLYSAIANILKQIS